MKIKLIKTLYYDSTNNEWTDEKPPLSYCKKLNKGSVLNIFAYTDLYGFSDKYKNTIVAQGKESIFFSDYEEYLKYLENWFIEKE